MSHAYIPVTVCFNFKFGNLKFPDVDGRLEVEVEVEVEVAFLHEMLSHLGDTAVTVILKKLSKSQIS
jgi:hypothetical protein